LATSYSGKKIMKYLLTYLSSASDIPTIPTKRHVCRLCLLAALLLPAASLPSRAQKTVLPAIEVHGDAKSALTLEPDAERAALNATPGGVNLIELQKISAASTPCATPWIISRASFFWIFSAAPII
jgi:hypothetical protein